MVSKLACFCVRSRLSIICDIYNRATHSLNNTKREDLVFVAFQFWVLGMSIVALLNESIPHIIASLVTHIMATIWAAFQIAHAADFYSDFNRVITNGACHNVSLLPNYWSARNQAEIPILTLNFIGLFVSCFLTWKLIKVSDLYSDFYVWVC